MNIKGLFWVFQAVYNSGIIRGVGEENSFEVLKSLDLSIFMNLSGALSHFVDEVPIDTPVDQKVNNVLEKFEIRLQYIGDLVFFSINLKTFE